MCFSPYLGVGGGGGLPRGLGGSLKRSARAVRAQCARSATIWASGRTRDAYFEILGASRGIMVTPSGGYARRSTFGSRHGKA